MDQRYFNGNDDDFNNSIFNIIENFKYSISMSMADADLFEVKIDYNECFKKVGKVKIDPKLFQMEIDRKKLIENMVSGKAGKLKRKHIFNQIMALEHEIDKRKGEMSREKAIQFKVKLHDNNVGNHKNYWNLTSQINSSKNHIMLEHNGIKITNRCDIINMAHIDYSDSFSIKRHQIDERKFIYVTAMMEKKYIEAFMDHPVILIDILEQLKLDYLFDSFVNVLKIKNILDLDKYDCHYFGSCNFGDNGSLCSRIKLSNADIDGIIHLIEYCNELKKKKLNLQNIMLDSRFSFQEFVNYVKHCNINAQFGLDGISVAVLKIIFEFYSNEFIDIYNSFIDGRNSSDQILALMVIVKHANIVSNKNVYVVFLDFTKMFDTA